MWRKIIFLHICLLFSLSFSAKDLYFQHVDLGADFTQLSAISIYQDSKGIIWFGNDNLNRYDGKNVRSFRVSDYLEDIVDDNIHNICGDGDSLLFFLADTELIIFNKRTEQFRRTFIQAYALEFHQGRLFYGQGNTLYSYDVLQQISEKCCVLPEACMIKDLFWHQDRWLIATMNGVFAMVDQSCELLLPHESATSLFVDRSNRLWVGTSSHGVWLNEEGEWILFQEKNDQYPLIGNQVRTINQDVQGQIWIGTYAGITIVDSETKACSHLSHNDRFSWSLKHSSIYAIYRDNQGGMWIGSYYGGLSYYNPNTGNYTFYPSSSKGEDCLNGFLFGNMTEDDEGHLYIATEQGHLNCIDRKTGLVVPFLSDGGKCLNTTKSVWFDTKRHSLYIGTFQQGLYCYSSDGKLQEIGSELLIGASQRTVTALIPWNDRLIVVTQGGVFLLALDSQRLSPLFTEADLANRTTGIIRTAFLDSQNRLWLTPAGKGIVCIQMADLSEEKIEIVNRKMGKKPILDMAEDKENNLYFAVHGVGVLQHNVADNSWICYNKKDGELLTDEPFRIAITPTGHLLVTTVQGIMWLDRKKKKSSYTLLGISSPLHRLNSNCGLYISPLDSMIFIGGVEGLIATKEAGLSIEKMPYSLFFNSLYVNNEPANVLKKKGLIQEDITYLSQLILPYDLNNLTIGFTSTNYRYPDKNVFEYKLEGLDKQWMRTRHQQIVYTSLSPGNYRLLVREASNEGKQIALDIAIRPPFYASTYAYLFYVFILFLFVTWLVRFNRSRALLKASLLMEHQEKLRIEEMNRMKLKFYINISHELRTPLTLMVSQIDLLLHNYQLEHLFRNKLLKIRQYTSQMQQLITEVLDYRRLEQGKMPMHATCQDLIAFVKPIFDSFHDYAVMNQIRYRLDISEVSIPIWFDPVQIKKVFNNLLSNAFKFTPKTGRITVTIRRRNDVAEISVSDTGSGIDQRQLAHIFERFYQADNAIGTSLSGSGIGLALTHEIIEQHKGTITVESELDKGTTFIVSLQLGDNHLTEEQKGNTGQILVDQLTTKPILKEQELSLSNSGGQATENSEEKELSVLLVEDHEDLLQLMEEAFSLKYNVYMAKNGKEGLRLAEEFQPNIIISDLMMPEMSGTMMCQTLKRKLETSHIPIIFLTARTDLESALEAMKCGASDYIMKPFNMELLLLKCHNIIQTLKQHKTRFLQEVEVSPSELATNRLDQQLLDDSVRIIESNLENKDFNIDMWCRMIAIGRTRLGMKIKGITGLTLNEFILQIRLRKCTYLLETTNLTISEITWGVGFSSPGYMGKCFKEHFGMTPLQYRKSKQKSI